MKVERARSEGSVHERPDTNARNIRLQPLPGTAQSKPAETHGAFSKVLDSARQAPEKETSEKRGADADGDPTVDKPGDGKAEDAVEAKDGRRDDRQGFSDENGDGNDHAWAPAALPLADGSVETSTAAPPARAILHVADLERIVSAVRSNAFAGSKQVTIDLKNSVLDGLQIQLTMTEQGNLKAEFIALNEQIKKQLDARKGELQSVLKDRSIKLAELKIRVLDDKKASTSQNHPT